MLDKILSFLAPHYCCGCGKIGSLLCHNCINDIIDDDEVVCISCCRPTVGDNLCKICHTSYERAWLVGKRSGVLQRLIGLYKFQRSRAGYKDLGDLLLARLPDLPPETIIVPIPTVSSHVRERGYDHMLLIAKYVAKKRHLELARVLRRQTNTKQRQSGARQRDKQARAAFTIDSALDKNKNYLLIDDVVTTGATLKYASKVLIDAGAKHVWVAAIARQTIDN